jgi:serine phosphatase RsbU (regulator of sigma subunit)
MVIQTLNNEIRLWLEVIYNPDNLLIQKISSNWPEYKENFIKQVAGYLYNDIQRTQHLFKSPYTFKKEFGKLSDEEKSDWYAFASEIPGKLRSLNLFIRQYRDFCRTCLIPYYNLEKLGKADHERYCMKYASVRQVSASRKDSYKELVSFRDLPEERKRFYVELNHLIPVALKKVGYEIVRPEEIAEINDKMVRRLARAIHSMYLKEIRKQNSGYDKKIYLSWIHNQEEKNIADFDKLPEEIRHSNLDNAFHIPTKLLSIGYKIRPVGKGFKPAAMQLGEEEVETMARVEHLRWCWDKILHGWHYGVVKDNRRKIHPSIIPYEDLSEPEKEKDRELIRLIPALLQDIGYEASPVNPDRISKLPYAIKPLSSIHKILDETRQMNTQIRKMVILSPEIDEKVNLRNRKIEEAIKEVESSYNYAQHIQKAFLPDNLYVRECFPESFILFQPKDIVSGDFYFFSKQDNLIIFAAADCTGHGIPGALLSTIGYGIIDQAVNEIKLTDPTQILNHLYSRIHRFLRNDESGTEMSDDMDIALCVLDMRTNILTCAGVKNPLYRIVKGELIEYKAKNLRENCNEDGECPFISEKIKLSVDDTLYLFSDGFIDQFGGKGHKKYQSSRFKSFLLSIQDYSMPEQSDKLYEEIEKWREENAEDQTDDILVIGIRI